MTQPQQNDTTQQSGPPKPRIPPTLSRKRPPPEGDEEATTTLRLGDMSSEQALSCAEVTLMLDQIEKSNTRRPNHTEIYFKTRDYCRMFARFKDDMSIRHVNQVSTELTAMGFGITQFERAQLATLCCDGAEEAKTLIPSLEGKISDEDLDAVIGDISKRRDFS